MAPALYARCHACSLLSSVAQLRQRAHRRRQWRLGLVLAAQGPSCLFIGPVETASKEMLEALYHQARDSYYSGKPLIVDDMFDKVEEDSSQFFALASIWMLLLAFGTSTIVAPIIYSISLALSDTVDLRYFLFSNRSQFELIMMVHGFLFTGLGCLLGFPIASASVQGLQGLWRRDLVALKGSCPNCGEEVFAFVKAGNSVRHHHRADCHVCECSLEFRTKVEETSSAPGRRWVYGRVYLVQIQQT